MSRVLRAEQLPSGAAIFSLADFEREAAGIISRARGAAESIVAEARAAADGIREEAHRQGREAGHAEGLAAGAEEGRQAGREQGLAETREGTRTLADAMKDLVQTLSARRAELVKDAESDLLSLAVKIAGRVVRRELAVDRDAAARAVSEAISLVADRSRVIVRLNPEDLEAVRAVHAELAGAVAELRDVELAADAAVDRGGCVISSAAGEVDMRVDAQLELIARLLLGRGLDGASEPGGGGGA